MNNKLILLTMLISSSSSYNVLADADVVPLEKECTEVKGINGMSFDEVAETISEAASKGATVTMNLTYDEAVEMFGIPTREELWGEMEHKIKEQERKRLIRGSLLLAAGSIGGLIAYYLL